MNPEIETRFGLSSAQLRDRRTRIKVALASPVFFGEYYVRPFDENWVTPLPEFGQEMLRFAITERRGVIVLPPEFLKTTLLSQVLPLWLTYRATYLGKLLRGMLLSEEEGMAVSNLSVVSWHILNNPMLQHDFSDAEGRPVVYPDPQEQVWRDDALIIARKGASKDPTWQAKGLDSKGIQGRRIDWLIGDDVITPRNASSPAMRRRALDLWDLQITTRLVEHGKAIICGNFNDSRDLLSTLAQRPAYEEYRRPALHVPGNPSEPDPDGEPLWPENWSRERLQRERSEKPQRFRRIFLLDSRAESGERLQIDWVQLIHPDETPLDYCRFYIGIDPAPGGHGDDLDFFTVTVLAAHKDQADIVESVAVREPIHRQAELAGVMHDRYARVGSGVVAIGGARVAMDRYFRGAMTAKRPDLAAKMVEVSVPGHKEERLEALGAYAQSGWLRCWERAWAQQTSDPKDRHQELSLFEEWRDFPHGRHDDRLDSLDVAVRTAQEFSVLSEVTWDLEVIDAT